MSSSATTSVDSGTHDGLLSYLATLDRYQMEEFKLCLLNEQLLLGNFQPIPWANLKAADPRNLFLLLSEHFPGWQAWQVALIIFQNMGLTSLCEKARAEMNENMQTRGPQEPNQEESEMPEDETGHRRKYRERMKAKILVMWSKIPWPEDHIYLRSVTEKEHEELKSLLDPQRTGAQAQTIVLHGKAGVGKTTLAMKAMLHWAEGHLFEHRFSYVFYLSCHKMKDVEKTTFAELLSWDWPSSQAPVEELMSQPEKLLFIIDGFEEMTMLSDDRPPCTDWHRKLPVARLLESLLRKKLVPMATLLITTRTVSKEGLQNLLVNPCFVPTIGFTEGDQEEYFSRHFCDQKEAKRILHWLRGNETLFNLCCAPMVCWTVCSSLKQQKVRNRALQLGAQTTTSLYASFFSDLFATADVNLADRRWPEQWRALCSLAAEGMWSATFTFKKVDIRHWRLEAPVINALLKLNILREVSDCKDCITFTHSSFQEFFAAMFYVLVGTKGSLGSSTKLQELRMLLNDVLLNTNIYWKQMALFLFGLLQENLARQLEDTLHCKMSPMIKDELLEWVGEFYKPETASVQFESLQYFFYLYETQEEDFMKQVLGHILEADLDIVRKTELQVASFCLKHCQRLNKLRLSVSSPILQRQLTSDSETPECKSMSPVMALKELALAIDGNKKLTHLNLSSNNLGITVARLVFRALKHSACNLKYLWLESCGLTSAICQHLFLALSENRSLRFLSLGDNGLSDLGMQRLSWSFLVPECPLKELSLEKCHLSLAACQDLDSLLSTVHRMTHLCLGFNQLQDDGVELLCAALTHPQCALRRLVLWFCQLGAPSCKHLSGALLQNKSLTHLDLRKNSLGDEGLKFLCEALGRPDCKLENLDLSECSLTTEGCRELAGALKENHHVRILDIGKNDLQDEGVKLLCGSLRRPNCVLNTLGLEKCNLTPACCQHLSSVISSKNLRALNLIGNDLKPEGVKTLCEALRKSTCKLRKLGLQKDLANIVRKETLKLLRGKDSFLKIQYSWDFNDPGDRWWW